MSRLTVTSSHTFPLSRPVFDRLLSSSPSSFSFSFSPSSSSSLFSPSSLSSPSSPSPSKGYAAQRREANEPLEGRERGSRGLLRAQPLWPRLQQHRLTGCYSTCQVWWVWVSCLLSLQCPTELVPVTRVSVCVHIWPLTFCNHDNYAMCM